MMQFHLTTEPSRERVLHYFRALRAHGVPPSAHTYKLLLDTFAVLQPTDLPAMERVFADLCADPDVKVQGTHWASIIAAYGIYGNDMAKAIETFESIPMHPSTRDPRTAAEPGVWEAILSVISAEGTLEDLETMRQRMVASGVKGNAYVNNVLISGYARAGEIEKAREVFESMGDSVTGVAAPNNHPTLLTSSGHVKPSTVTAEPTHVVYREPSTYESMIRAELRAGTREAAEAVCARMEERRYPVAVYMRGRAVLDEQVVSVFLCGVVHELIWADDHR
jgi:pentatricopeptide repeat protein